MNESKKKKVLYFVPEFPKISETFIHREIEKLLEFGNLDITVFSLVKASGETVEGVKQITHYQRINIFTCIIAFFKYILPNPRKIFEIHKLIKGNDVVPYFITMHPPQQIEGRTSFFAKITLSRLVLFFKGIAYARLFEKFEPDQIHVHFFSSPSTIALIASKVLEVPFSISAHARDVFVDGSLISVKSLHAEFVVVCNGHTWSKCIELAGEDKSSKIYKIFHGVDANKIFSGEQKLTKPNRPVILTVARLVEKKGLRYLIEASKILKDRGIDHQIDVIGPGPLFEQLTDLIISLGLDGNVNIHGDGEGLSFSETAEFYKIADIFALPSIETGEGDVDGVPTAVIEAALAKLPIITTSAGSITDLMDENIGVLIQQKDSYELATAIEKLIYYPDQRVSLGERAYKKASKMFDINKNVAELEKLLLRS